MSKKRDTNIEFIRAISMFLVIGVHVAPKPCERSELFSAIFLAILLTCNSNFYMLSGQLNLKKSFETSLEYRNYYIKRFVTIIFPYATITVASILYEAWLNKERLGMRVLGDRTLRALMSTNAEIHFWFMYPLIGFIACAPFLAKMLNKMKDFEVNILFWLVIIWNAIFVYIGTDLGYGFCYSGCLFSGTTVVCFLGYYSERMINENNKKKWYLLGVIGFVIGIICRLNIPDRYQYANDLATTYLFFSMGVYTFLRREIRISNIILQKIISVLSKHAFTVYMVHWTVLRYISPKYVVFTGSNTRYFCTMVLVTFLISFVIAVAFDDLIFIPIQKLSTKKLEK